MKYILATCMAMTTTTLLLLMTTLQTTEARYASINVNLAMNVSEDSHQLSEDMVRICAQETDISMDELHKLRQQDFKNSTAATTQCFVHCIYEQMGLLRYGVFVKRDVIRALVDITDPQTFAIYKECHGLRGANKCETAYKIHQCHREHDMRKAGVMPPLTTTTTQAAAPTGGAQAVEVAASGAGALN